MATALLLSTACQATSLQQLVQLLVAPPARTGSQGEPGELSEMSWEPAAPAPTGRGLSRSASGNVEGLGKVTIVFSGGKDGARQASLRLPQGVDQREFETTLLRLIPLAGVRKQSDCAVAGQGSTRASMYQVAPAGSDPAYVLLRSSRVASSIDTELIVAASVDPNWGCE